MRRLLLDDAQECVNDLRIELPGPLTLDLRDSFNNRPRRLVRPLLREGIEHIGDGDDPIIILGQARQVSDSDEIARVDHSFRAKYVDPNSGAAAGYPETNQDLAYRIDIERIMAWEYGTVATRTDFYWDGTSWQATVPGRI